MRSISLRAATADDFDFAFEVKRLAIGPHILARWGWDEAFQIDLHRKRWNERPWFIIELDGQAVGTLSVQELEDHIRFGEFYLLPQHHNQGMGTELLSKVIECANALSLPIKLEYLKWNPVGSLYLRQGFQMVSENDIHYFMLREPSTQIKRTSTGTEP
jgi:GNAT superfamily N-acetyltransferase